MGKTVGLIFAIKDKVSPNIKKVADKIGITEKEAKKLDNQIKKLSKDLGGKLKTACKAVGAGVVSAVGTMSALAFKASQTCDRIDDLSNKIGISRKGFQEWDYLMAQNGGQIESLQMGFKKLVGQINGVTTGNKSAIKNFRSLGVSVVNASGKLKSQEQVFDECVSALQKMPEGAKKAQLANELFGRSGAELMPLLNQNAEVFKKQREEYKKLGITLSDDVIDAGNKFGDNLEKLKSIGTAFGASIGADVLPMINSLADELISHLPEIKSAVTPVFESLSNVCKFLIDNFGTLSWVATACLSTFVAYKAISGVVTTIQTLQKVIKAVSAAQGIWNALMLANPIGLIAVAVGLLITLIANWDKVKKACIDFCEKAKPVLEDVGNKIVTAFSTVFNWLKEKLAVVGKWIAVAFALTPIGAFINGLKLLVDNWDKVTAGIKKATDAVKKFLHIKGNGKTEVKTDDGTVVKKNAVGTSYYSGGLTRVNEFGGEIMDLPRGTRIIPHDVSKEMAKNSNNNGINVNITIMGNMVGNQEFLNQLVNAFSQKLQVAMAIR